MSILLFRAAQLDSVTARTLYEEAALAFAKNWQGGIASVEVQTSGSTGQPKRITLSRRQMQASAQLTGQTFGLQAGDTLLACLNTAYIAGMMMLVRGLELDLNIMLSPPSGFPLDDLPADVPLDFAGFVPLQLQNILTHRPQQVSILDRMKAIIVGGAAVNIHLYEAIQSLRVPVYSTYGMTETATHVAIRRLNGPNQSDDSFVTLEGVRLSQDTRGCLGIIGPMTDGQLIQTNDLVELSDSQKFRLLGRIDNVINSGGVKIQLEKVEQAVAQALHSLAINCRFFAAARPHPLLGDELIVVFEHLEIPLAMLQTLKTNTGLALLKYEVPRQWFFIEKFAETPTAKIDKTATFAYLPQL